MSDKKPPLVHLGMFETPDLLQELANRKNFEFVMAVCFTDGSSNTDPDTLYCVARLSPDSVDDFREVLDDYLEEIMLGAHDEEEESDDWAED